MKLLHWQMHSALSDVNPDIFKGLIGLMADPNENCITGGCLINLKPLKISRFEGI